MKRVDYFSLIDFEHSPGVAKKLTNTVEAIDKIGYSAKSYFFNLSIKGALQMLVAALSSKADIIFIRYSLILAPIFFFIMCYQRILGRKIIVDIPTPRCAVANEILNTKKLFNFAKFILLLFSGPWVLWPASRVIQYSQESAWFSFGLQNKTQKMGNGVLVNKIPLSKSTWDGEQPIEIVAVALLAYWHGYDRLLKALAKLEELHPGKFNLTIVGDGEELASLKSLATDLKYNRVSFTGMLDKLDLDAIYDKAHVGVSSLGLHRKGISEAADLKTREYTARGLMLLGSGVDIDFIDNPPFRLIVPSDESIEPIIRALEGISLESLVCKNEIRKFAYERLSMEVKAKEMLSGLL